MTLAEDRSFADELSQMWAERTPRQQRDLAFLWLDRVIRELLADVCRREGFAEHARTLAELPRGLPLVAFGAVADALLEVADDLYRVDRAHNERAPHVATLVFATSSVLSEWYSAQSDPPLWLICVRAQQVARRTPARGGATATDAGPGGRVIRRAFKEVAPSWRGVHLARATRRRTFAEVSATRRLSPRSVHPRRGSAPSVGVAERSEVGALLITASPAPRKSLRPS